MKEHFGFYQKTSHTQLTASFVLRLKRLFSRRRTEVGVERVSEVLKETDDSLISKVKRTKEF